MDENRKNNEEEMGLYEKLADRAKVFIEEAETKTAKAVDAALEKAKEEMVAAGDFTHEQGEKLKNFLQRDIILSLKDAAKAEDMTKEALEPHRVIAGIQSILACTLETVGEKLEDWGNKLNKELDYRTGQITTPGTLVCKGCENKIKMRKAGHIPPCPECRGTEFHKTY